MEKRVAIVTGASRGIGEAIARRLAAEGRHVVLAARSIDQLETIANEIKAAGGSADVHAVDITDQASIEALISDTAEKYGRLDILVNNAGITRDNLLLRMSDEEFDLVIQANLRSIFVACRAAIRPMMRGKFGRIVNIGSVSGVVGNAGQSNYAAAKAGLTGFTKSLAMEMGAKGITANVIAPGFIETSMTAELPQAVKDGVKAATATRRFGQPVEIACTAAFLTHDDAGYVTGQEIAVDGGMTRA